MTLGSGMGAERSALIVAHVERSCSATLAQTVAADLVKEGFTIRVLAGEADAFDLPQAIAVDGPAAADGVEIVFSLGGDGTFLRAAELARPYGAPLLGINLGKVGFLAEAEIHDLEQAVADVVAGTYTVDERMTLDMTATRGDRVVARSWALNEITVERGARVRMLELMVDVDGHSLSRYGCDGIVCATPTGSTAYAFSAGGPVVWPQVEAMLVVPISAHALFSRALVTAPSSTITIVMDPCTTSAMISCDGRRVFDVTPGTTVTVRRGKWPVRVVRVRQQTFTERLVAKFGLPVEGWRNNGRH